MPIEAAVKIVLDLGYDLGNNPTLGDYKKAFINATNELDPKDPRIPVLQKAVLAIKKTQAVSFVNGKSDSEGGESSSAIVKGGEIGGAPGNGNDLGIGSSLAKIEENVQGILDVFKDQLALDKKDIRDDKKVQQDADKKGREGDLEASGSKKIKGGALISKAIKPAQGIFDIIWRFVSNVLMGGAFLGLLKILQDPERILKPIRDALNGVITFYNDFLRNAINILNRPINFLIDGLNLGLKGIFAAVNGVLKLFQQEPMDVPQVPRIEAPKIPLIPAPGDPPSEPVQKMAQGGEVQNITFNNISNERGRSTVSGGVTTPRSGMSFVSGGAVTPRSGQRISGMGPDTQLIAAQPGEVVMSKKAVDYHGKDNLLAMNAEGGGTNRPTTGSGVKGYQGGGINTPSPVMGYRGGGAVRRNRRGRIIRRPATVAPSSPQVSTPSPPRGNNVTVVPITKPKQSQQPLNSGSSADQKTVALFSPIDFNNNERMGVRAEYQLV